MRPAQHSSRAVERVGPPLIFCVGVLCLGKGLWTGAHDLPLLLEGREAVGTVTELQPRAGEGVLTVAVGEFVTAAGHRAQFRLPSSALRIPLSKGQQLRLRYAPEDPGGAIAAAAFDPAATIVPLLAGVVLLFASLLHLRARALGARPGRRQPARPGPAR